MLHLLPFLLALGLSRAQNDIVLCDGNIPVDYEVCGAVAYNVWGSDPDSAPSGSWQANDPDKRNCQLEYGTTTDPDVTWGGLRSIYNRIRQVCEPQKVGGGLFDTFEGAYVIVLGNPDYEPPTVAEGNTTLLVRSHPRDLAVRQAEGDDGATIVNIKQGVIIEERGQRVAGSLPSGSQYTITESEAKTTGIESSFEAGGSFFEIFSVSAGLSISEDYTVTSTTGLSVNVDCPEGQTGIVFWQPIFDVYQGFGTPSQTSFEVRIPIEIGKGSYTIRCS